MRQKDRNIGKQAGKQAGRQTGRQVIGKQAGRQADTQAGRYIGKDREAKLQAKLQAIDTNYRHDSLSLSHSLALALSLYLSGVGPPAPAAQELCNQTTNLQRIKCQRSQLETLQIIPGKLVQRDACETDYYPLKVDHDSVVVCRSCEIQICWRRVKLTTVRVVCERMRCSL